MATLLPPTAARPWLLYGAPWLPYPRKVLLYLREKGIRIGTDVVIVHEHNVGRFPRRPEGSVPMLAIPVVTSLDADSRYTYIRQASSIIAILEYHCNKRLLGFTHSRGPMDGSNMGVIEQAKVSELQTLADELIVAWNPVILFGTDAGSISIPVAAKDSLRWVIRTLTTIERWWREEDKDMRVFQRGVYGRVTIADITLFSFLEFIRDGYGVDLTEGSEEERRDVYGRMVKEDFPKLREFFQNFGARESASRSEETADLINEEHKVRMMSWAKGVLE